MRLFIAINFEDEIKDRLDNLINDIKNYSTQGNFVKKEHMHLTLEFLGEIEPERISLIKDAMERITVNPFTLELSGIGFFKRKDGNIYWIGIKENISLLNLQKKLHNELLDRGFILESREYKPHLTIGRKVIMDESFNKDKYLKYIEDLNIEVNKIDLMKSENFKGKLIHSVIK